MKKIRGVVLIGLIVLYGCLFAVQDQRAQAREYFLEYALPVNFHTIAAGYLKQLAAEMLFIKTSVFLGGVRSSSPPASYEDALGNNFEVMTSLYPRFIDPYYFCQSFLAPISPEAAGKANSIFELAISEFPNDHIIRFFHASNFFLAMNEPLKGAKAFREAAKLPEAPPLFEHLAALLSAKGGDLQAGLLTLRTMTKAEKNDAVRARYQEEIAIFEQALGVQRALDAYTKQYGEAPITLEQLVPEFLPSLPEIQGSFILVYDRPVIRLQRPDRSR